LQKINEGVRPQFSQNQAEQGMYDNPSSRPELSDQWLLFVLDCCLCGRMGDLALPIVLAIKDESTAFWCFVVRPSTLNRYTRTLQGDCHIRHRGEVGRSPSQQDWFSDTEVGTLCCKPLQNILATLTSCDT
jgi:hypothetical protein